MRKSLYLCSLNGHAMEIIEKYFKLNVEQKRQFSMLGTLYEDWNSKINVISRKDIQNLYEHHVLHSLAIAKVLRFKDGTRIMDVGTGGGFPGIPLAVMFPECRFTLVDSVGKKLTVASEIAKAIGLDNVDFVHGRVEEVKEKYEFIVSRAAMELTALVRMTKKNIAKEQKNALPNGLICLKGGNLQNEVFPYRMKTSIYELSDYFSEEYFKTKKALYMPL